MDRTELEMTVADLVGVEPKSIGADEQASEAAQWIDLQKKTEAEADTLLDPAIRGAFNATAPSPARRRSSSKSCSPPKIGCASLWPTGSLAATRSRAATP